jgi:hypothetical protein
MVRNMNLLKSMKKAGLVTFHKQTGTKVGIFGDNKKITAYYVYDGQSAFIFKAKFYRTKYVDGCFFPFIFLDTTPIK